MTKRPSDLSIDEIGSPTAANAIGKARIGSEERKVIIAASVGTVLEWYDFMLYGAMTSVIAAKFFGNLEPSIGFVFALLTFSAGFLVRPLGALVFGRVGDMIGRKHSFLVTVLIMGLATFVVGLLPTTAQVGLVAPIALISLRMLQGLALGGEYGGAVIYVCEHSPSNRRGFNTSWIQLTAGLGLLLSLVVILVVRKVTGAAFDTWGWRIPFLVSLPLLAVSVYVRTQMHESPAFEKMKNEGTLSRAPLAEAFTNWNNLKLVLVALLGVTAGMSATYYCSLIYPTFFMTQVLRADLSQVNLVMAAGIIYSLPMFIFFGWLSDRIGRKPLLLCSFALVTFTLIPVFKGITHFANPALEAAHRRAPVVLMADPNACSFMFNPVGSREFTQPCDVARKALTERGISYSSKSTVASEAQVKVGGKVLVIAPGASPKQSSENIGKLLVAAGYPTAADPKAFNTPGVILMVMVLMTYMSMAFAPIAATLVEMFPTRIRYTSMSLPYHVSAGWVGGLLPTVTFAMSAQRGDLYFGLWYTIGFTILGLFVVGVFFKERNGVELDAV